MSRKGMTGSLFLATFLWVICSLGAGVSSGETSDRTQPFDSGKVPPEIRDKIVNTGKAEILLLLDERDIKARAALMRKSLNLKHDTGAIRSEKAQLYRDKKNRVLSRLSPKNHKVLKDYANLPIMYIEVNEQALAGLSGSADISSVDRDLVLRPHLTQSLPLIRAPQSQSAGNTGAGTSVAVLDTGVDYSHDAFGNCSSPGNPASCKVAHVQDFAPDDGSRDDNGHGTNVSGIVVGVAPDTKILGLDVFRTDSSAYYSDILDALDWVIATKDTYNTVAVNMSFGGGQHSLPCPGDTIAVAIGTLKSVGITTIVSSGNDGYTNALAAPACAPDAISTGAVYDSDLGHVYWSDCTDPTADADIVTCFSNSASFLTMLAPGAIISSAGISMGGTSQASPHISGAVAVLKANNSGLTVDQVISRLTNTGVPVFDTRNSLTKPRIDLYAALMLTNPYIESSASSLSFMAAEGGVNPVDQILRISNGGGGTLDWDLAKDASWLSLSPTSGTDTGDVAVSVNTTELAVGTYNAVITVTAPGAMNSPRTVPVTLEVKESEYTEDYETGNLTKFPWTTGGNGLWTVQNSTKHTGAYAAQSPLMVDNQSSYLQVTLNVTSPGYVYFWLKTSTEPVWDTLKFRIDGSNEGNWNGWSGETAWTFARSTDEVAPGIHTFRWEYSKDNSLSSGSDAVWIDDLFFPPFNLPVPNISSSPSSHNFGTVAVGASSSAHTFSVSNTGTADLILGTLSLAGTDADQFGKENDTCSGQTLLPSAACTLDVRFTPQSGGAKTAALSVPSNDPDTQTLNISLSGTGETQQPPVAEFSASPVSGPAPLSVTFTDSSINSPSSWSWTFGDSGTSTQQDPVYVYQNAGTYTVSLTATNAAGSSAETKTGYITVTCPILPVRITGAPPVYYGSLQGAYAMAADSALIQVQAVSLTETINLNRNIAFTLKGGYDACFTANPGSTTLTGSLTVTSGTAIAENIVIQ